jgi:hypothetical protein
MADFPNMLKFPLHFGNIAMEHRHFEYLNQLQMLVGGLELFFIFPSIGNLIFIFFRGVGQPPTCCLLSNLPNAYSNIQEFARVI